MIRVTLKRFETSAQGTFGELVAPGVKLYTGELPWENNESNISCIPRGVYHCSWTYSSRFKRRMYLVDNVKNRSGIRFHSANLMGSVQSGYRAQLNGCIALGEKLGWIEKQKALLVSSSAVRKFETALNGQPFILEVL